MSDNDKNPDHHVLAIDMDTLKETYGFRIPTCTKDRIDRLSKTQKKKLKEDLMITVARALHNADFDPNKYFKEED